MDGNRTADTKAPEKAPEQARGVVGWLEDNVAKPFVTGTGVLQVASNFTSERVSWQAPESKNKVEWAVQNLSSAAGALLMYVPMGKAAGGLLSAGGRALDGGLIGVGFAEGLGTTGARLFASESAAQILGAGAYDALKRPGEGETRTGNAIGSMVGFGAFELGNRGMLPAIGNSATALGAKQFLNTTLGETSARVAGAIGTGAGRYVAGVFGGLAGFEASHGANAYLTGNDYNATSEQRWDAIYSGAFINFGMPLAQRLGTKVVDKTFNSPEWGRGIPVGRQISYLDAAKPDAGFNHQEIQKLAAHNPLARVKTATDGVTRADVKANVVYLGEGEGAGKLAHELTHLRLAREIEPEYLRIGKMVKAAKLAGGDTTEAEQKFYQLRSYAESAARMSEARVSSAQQASVSDTAGGSTPFDMTKSISQQRAGNGRTYEENWREEWTQFKDNTNFRPRIEFDGETFAKPTETSSSPVWGSPDEWGATIRKAADGKVLGTNFAVHGADATAVDLLLFDSADAKTPTQRLPMFRTGDVWHRFVPDVGEGQKYLLQADGPYDPANGKRVNRNLVLIDPNSLAVTGDTDGPIGYDNSNPNDPNRDRKMGTESSIDKMPKSIVIDPDKFDWTGDKQPSHSLDDTIILEVNIPGFTLKDPSVPEHLRGTYAGFGTKAEWLKDFGITDVQAMPTMEYDADDWGKVNPLTGDKLYNSWGYNTVAFKAPEHSYAATGNNGEQVTEFQKMSYDLRQKDVGLIPDIVLNHTREGDEHGPTIEFKGLSNEQAYILNPGDKGKYENHTGTGNTVNTNHPAMRKFILDTLHYWHDKMRVTGFRFDLASTFKFDTDGQHKWKTPIIEAIETDPKLSKLKLIAEPWTAGTAYDRGAFSDKVWMEQDGKFRDTVRKFVKGDDGQIDALIEHIKGSPKTYNREFGRIPNTFVVYHDGMTSRDLVMYNEKRNWENGENNTDGANDNNSWNTGWEGPVKDAPIPEESKKQIEDMRMQLMKNKMVLLLMSQGVPIIYYQDLFGQSNDGNNNIWAQKNKNVLNWDLENESPEFHDFLKYLVHLRRDNKLGRWPGDILFHGVEPYKPDTSWHSKSLGFTLPNTAQGKNFHVYMNAWWEPLTFKLPSKHNFLVTDTSQHLTPGLRGAEAFKAQQKDVGDTYTLPPRAFAIFTSDDIEPPPKDK